MPDTLRGAFGRRACSRTRPCARIDRSGRRRIEARSGGGSDPRRLNGLDSGFRAILVIALVIQLAIVLTGIVSRFWFDESLLWADEAAKLFLSLTAFVGGALAFRARHHTTVEFLTGQVFAAMADVVRGRDRRC